MQIIKRFTVIILALFAIIWIISLGKCEVLTLLHGDEFSEIYRENTMMGEIDYLKVLNYSGNSARVYYVSANKASGDILRFSRTSGEWRYDSWERTVWSSTGSASDVIWPYWWHFIYGGF